MSLTRDETILTIRPEIQSIDLSKSLSISEFFQNETLRPILKYQNDIIQSLFLQKSKAPQLALLDIADQRHRISKILESNTVLRNQLIGLVIALMTNKELESYYEMEAEIKRRIKTMLVERLISKSS